MKQLLLVVLVLASSYQTHCTENVADTLQSLSVALTTLEQKLLETTKVPHTITEFVNRDTFIVNNTTVHLMQGDITKLLTEKGMRVDAIVNAANAALKEGAGVCGAIFAAARYLDKGDSLTSYIQKKWPRGIQTGQAVTTPSFNLEKTEGVDFIIHAVGPIYAHYTPEVAATLLTNAYTNSLKEANSKKIESIAFPFISSAIYRYPKPAAAHIALTAIIDYLKEQPTSLTDIYFTLFSEKDLKIFQDSLRNIFEI